MPLSRAQMTSRAEGERIRRRGWEGPNAANSMPNP